MANEEPYSQNENGIFVPARAVEHREEEYDSDGFAKLKEMQSRHFWYLGRHRFLLRLLKEFLPGVTGERGHGLQGADLGGGCGGWISYLTDRAPALFEELALADSSPRALTLAGDVLGPDVKRYQVDLLQLRWKERWDVAFLLDVLEHIPQELEVLREIHESLRPGGILLVATPALNFFWTYNDVFANHVRRYSRKDFHRLANDSGFELCSTRYFMFFLSPLLLLSRMNGPDVKNMTKQQIHDHMERTHRVPPWLVNQALRSVFSLETPLGIWFRFPWGTSIAAVLRKRK